MTIYARILQCYFIFCAAYQDIFADNTVEAIKYIALALLITGFNLERRA